MKREKKQREKLWEEATGHCVYCGKPVSLEAMETDHIVPLCLGGENSYKNKVCSCPHCNASKAGKALEDYLQENMNASQRKHFSNRVNHLAEQGKMSWTKAELLDPYAREDFDSDWDYELPPLDREGPLATEAVKSLRFSGEMVLEFW